MMVMLMITSVGYPVVMNLARGLVATVILFLIENYTLSFCFASISSSDFITIFMALNKEKKKIPLTFGQKYSNSRNGATPSFFMCDQVWGIHEKNYKNVAQQ